MRKLFSKLWHLKRRWKILIIIAIIIIIAIFSGIFNQGNKQAYLFDTVKLDTVTELVSESGAVEVAAKTDIFSPTRGVISELYVKNGDIVGVNQKLFKVVSTATEDQKIAANSNLLKAKDALNSAVTGKEALQAKLEQARQAILQAETAVKQKDNRVNATQPNPATQDKYTPQEIQSIDSALTSARYTFNTIEKQYLDASTSIAAANAAYKSAQLAYQSTQDRIVISPAIGTVANLSVMQGDSVTSYTGETGSTSLIGLDTQTAVPIMTVANFSSNRVVLNLRESDIPKVKVGQTVLLTPDNSSDQTYQGVVNRVDEIGYSLSGVVKYAAYIEISETDDQLKSGMTVDVDILTQQRNNVLTVANTAIKPYQGGKAVRILDSEGKIIYQPVTVGLKGETRTEVIDGLQEGQQVITSLTNAQLQRNSGLGF